jgi:hypothetical protein
MKILMKYFYQIFFMIVIFLIGFNAIIVHVDKDFIDTSTKKGSIWQYGAMRSYWLNKFILNPVFGDMLSMPVPDWMVSSFEAKEVTRPAFNEELESNFQKLGPGGMKLLNKYSDKVMYWCVPLLLLCIGFYFVWIKLYDPTTRLYRSIAYKIDYRRKRKAAKVAAAVKVLEMPKAPEISPEEKARQEQERKARELQRQEEAKKEMERRATEEARKAKEKVEEEARKQKEREEILKQLDAL